MPIFNNRENQLIDYITKNLELCIETTPWYETTKVKIELKFKDKVISEDEFAV